MLNNMLNNIVKVFKNYFKVEEELKYTNPSELQPPLNKIIIPDTYSFKKINSLKPTILLMDDFSGIPQLLVSELKRIPDMSIDDNFNIILSTGIFAAFSVEKLLKTDQKIDIAFLDITIGGVINNVEYDGIDVAIMIKQKYPDSIIKFITGHTLNKHNPEIFKFIEKFETFFNVKIDETVNLKDGSDDVEVYEHIIQKNGDRQQAMKLALNEYYDLKNIALGEDISNSVIKKGENIRESMKAAIHEYYDK